MYLKFSNISEVDLLKFFSVYEKPDNTSQWVFENELYEDLCLFFQCPGVFLAAWEVDGEITAIVRIEPYHDGHLITCLETNKYERRKGYASLLLSSVMDDCPGVYYAHIDKHNKPSLRLHEKLGFRVFLNYAVYVDGSVYSSSLTMKR